MHNDLFECVYVGVVGCAGWWVVGASVCGLVRPSRRGRDGDTAVSSDSVEGEGWGSCLITHRGGWQEPEQKRPNGEEQRPEHTHTYILAGQKSGTTLHLFHIWSKWP